MFTLLKIERVDRFFNISSNGYFVECLSYIYNPIDFDILDLSDRLSKKIRDLNQKKSPIKEIMSFSDPEYIASFGINNGLPLTHSP